MRTKKGAIFSSSPLSSEKFETANCILSKHCKGMLENYFYPCRGVNTAVSKIFHNVQNVHLKTQFAFYTYGYFLRQNRLQACQK